MNEPRPADAKLKYKEHNQKTIRARSTNHNKFIENKQIQINGHKGEAGSTIKIESIPSVVSIHPENQFEHQALGPAQLQYQPDNQQHQQLLLQPPLQYLSV